MRGHRRPMASRPRTATCPVASEASSARNFPSASPPLPQLGPPKPPNKFFYYCFPEHGIFIVSPCPRHIPPNSGFTAKTREAPWEKLESMSGNPPRIFRNQGYVAPRLVVPQPMAGPVLFSLISAFIGLFAGLIGIRIVGYEKGFGHSVSRRCIKPNPRTLVQDPSQPTTHLPPFQSREKERE